MEETNARHHLIDSCFKDLFRQGVFMSLGLFSLGDPVSGKWIFASDLVEKFC